MLALFKISILSIASIAFTYAVLFASFQMFDLGASEILLRGESGPLIIIAVCMTIVVAAFINDLFFWLADRFDNQLLRVFREVPLGAGPEGAIGVQIQPFAIHQKLLTVYPLAFFMMLTACVLIA